MKDDFETRNMSRVQVARELESAREKYRLQLQSVQQLREEAPTEPLANRYRELEAELADSIRKLDDLLGETRQQHPEHPPEAYAPPALAPSPVSPPPPPEAPPVQYQRADTPPSRTSEEFRGQQVESDRGRMLAILAGGAIALILLGVLVWYFAFRTPAPATIREQPDPAVTTTVPETSALLTITPAMHDFGVVRKGTRAVRQFRLSNESDEPLEVSVERSTCRCLWYDFESTIPPNEATVLAITFDGSRAPGGLTREELTISAGPDPSRQVTATIVATVE